MVALGIHDAGDGTIEHEELIHLAPVDPHTAQPITGDTVRVRCCGKLLRQIPWTDRTTTSRDLVTCPGIRWAAPE